MTNFDSFFSILYFGSIVLELFGFSNFVEDALMNVRKSKDLDDSDLKAELKSRFGHHHVESDKI